MFTWDIFWDIVWRIGLPFGLVMAALWFVFTDRVVTRGHYDDMKHSLEEQIVRQRTDSDAELERERTRSADLWDIVRPSITVARGALDRVEGRANRR